MLNTRKDFLQLAEYKINSDKEVQLYKTQEKRIVEEKRIQSKLYYQRQRTYEARIIGMLLLCSGVAFAYQAYYTTDVVVSFFNAIHETVGKPFFPQWQTLMLDESSYLYGYIAQGINAFLRLLLLVGVGMKKVMLLALQVLTGLASTGNWGAVLVVCLVTVLITVTTLKLYISDFQIASPLVWISFQAPK